MWLSWSDYADLNKEVQRCWPEGVDNRMLTLISWCEVISACWPIWADVMILAWRYSNVLIMSEEADVMILTWKSCCEIADRRRWCEDADERILLSISWYYVRGRFKNTKVNLIIWISLCEENDLKELTWGCWCDVVNVYEESDLAELMWGCWGEWADVRMLRWMSWCKCEL